MVKQTDLATMLVADLKGFADPQVRTRVKHLLMQRGITTLEQLLRCSEQELLDFRMFGPICLAQLKAALSSVGLELKREPDGR